MRPPVPSFPSFAMSTRKSLHYLMLILTGASLPEPALADLKFYSGRTEYLLVTTAKTWDQAEDDAIARGGHLARIDDAAGNALILGKLGSLVTTTAADGGAAKYVWTGGCETATEGTYAWADGSPFWAGGSSGSAQDGLYQNWGRNPSPHGGPEPDDYHASQNRTAMAMGKWPVAAASGEQIGDAGQWNDLDHTNALFYLIERPITKPAEGLFAVFEMSHGGVPAGSFTCQLRYDKAPVTVANFITLAEGTRNWIDAGHGRVSTQPLYDGLKCHRIISNFMIQGGDPNGDGSGGPGYRFIDEFDPSLRHDHPGVLSMANSGANSNGSQFFVTVAATNHLNDKHTIFGEVVEGYESCVLPLSKVATAAADVPVQDVRITRVTIERLGAAAEAFDPLDPAWRLPVCSMHQTRLERSTAGALTLHWTEPANCSYTLVDSPDLNTWSGQSIDYYSGNNPTVDQSITVTSLPPPGARRHFFHLAKAVYQPLPPPSPQGRRFVLTGKTRGINTTITVSTPNGGSHLIEQASSALTLNSTLSQVEWDLTRFDSADFSSDIDPPYGYLTYSFTHSDWELSFNNATSGTFRGGFYTADRSLYLPESGNFSVEELP